MCFFQAEDGIRDLVRSRGLGDVYKRQEEKDVKTKDLLSWNPKNSAGHPEVRVPERFAEGARSVRILDKDGKVIAAGKFIKFGPAGRAVFQLPKKDYPEGIIVEVTQKNGTVRKLEIPNSDVRYKNPLA